MGALTFLLTWVGYTTMTYGLALVRGCNVTFSEIALPKGFLGMNKGGYTGCHGDTSSANQNSTVAKNAAILGQGTSLSPASINAIART